MGTHYKGAEQEERALNVFIKLMRASESLTSRINRHLTSRNITVSQFGILETLYHLGPLNQCDIARKILRSGGNITFVIDNLEKSGLVRRERGKDDRRFFKVHLTEDGERLISELFPEVLKIIVNGMETLSNLEQETLGGLCRKLGLKQRENR